MESFESSSKTLWKLFCCLSELDSALSKSKLGSCYLLTSSKILYKVLNIFHYPASPVRPVRSADGRRWRKVFCLLRIISSLTTDQPVAWQAVYTDLFLGLLMSILLLSQVNCCPGSMLSYSAVNLAAPSVLSSSI